LIYNFSFQYYQILMAPVKLELHNGQFSRSNLGTQSTHRALCPHGISACVLTPSLHTTHKSSSFLRGNMVAIFWGTGAYGIYCSSSLPYCSSQIAKAKSSGTKKSASLYSSSGSNNQVMMRC